MKLIRFGEVGSERPGIIDSAGSIRDLAQELGNDANHIDLANLGRMRSLAIEELPTVGRAVRLAPCVANVGKLIGVGVNYRRHAEESGLQVPYEPVLFSKATTSLCGPADDVMMPQHAIKVDWEVELAVVIGRRASYVAEEDALEHVAGYCVINDVSDRGLQLEGTGQWLKGKSLDGFAPLGPWLVTADEVPDPQNLRLWTTVNDIPMQDSTTADMVFPVRHLISYISRYMTLLPGDVVATGTPEGVGMGQTPPRYLQDGDVVRLGIQGLGEQRQVFRRMA